MKFPDLAEIARRGYEVVRAILAYAALVFAMEKLGRIDQLILLHPLFSGLKILYAVQGGWEVLGLLRSHPEGSSGQQEGGMMEGRKSRVAGGLITKELKRIHVLVADIRKLLEEQKDQISEIQTTKWDEEIAKNTSVLNSTLTKIFKAGD